MAACFSVASPESRALLSRGTASSGRTRTTGAAGLDADELLGIGEEGRGEFARLGRLQVGDGLEGGSAGFGGVGGVGEDLGEDRSSTSLMPYCAAGLADAFRMASPPVKSPPRTG